LARPPTPMNAIFTFPGLQADSPGRNESPAAAMDALAINDLLDKSVISLNLMIGF
jgi:hypothetical protein